MKTQASFPDGFLWGAATAAYQVEGAANEDGRGQSIWDHFAHQAGRIVNNDNADVSADQYHRYGEDIALMQWLGVKAYRFSISWPRVLPEGHGNVNAKGLDYYDRLTDALLAAGIEPWATLFHWDLPLTLERAVGGWTSRRTAEWFGEYAALIGGRLGDRIRNFMTINEFFCIVDRGYAIGDLAPGRKEPPEIVNRVRHNALLGHGLAVQALRANAPGPVQIGLADSPSTYVPVIETDEHIDAARKAYRDRNVYIATILDGAYPQGFLAREGEDSPQVETGDMDIISSPLDFVGINVYNPTYVMAADTPEGYEIIKVPEAYPTTNMAWQHIGPEVTYWGPRHLHDIWGVPVIYITENGACCHDSPDHTGRIMDTDRVMYLRHHLGNLQRAAAEGIPVRGYFCWSLLDNFEWIEGFSKRFGLIYVNYRTLERTPKLSSEYYRQVIRNNAVM